MKILSIETSCDETAVSIVDASGGLERLSFRVCGNALFSQVDLHKEYGGVFPNLAKREHAKNLPPLLVKALTDAGMIAAGTPTDDQTVWSEIEQILSKEHGLYDGLKAALGSCARPDLDLIAVTSGPGLEPALWVGISCATALGKLWNIPVVPQNHMEGHTASVLMETPDERPVTFPALALLISGGHTELVSIAAWGQYKLLGATRDDAVGEAFDKAARMLGLPYPGGPEISRLAARARAENLPRLVTLPRPMIQSGDFDFSFSGLKTAVLYYIRDHADMSEDHKADLAREFEDAAVDVLTAKTAAALQDTGATTLIVAGGVISNTVIREAFTGFESRFPGLSVRIPTRPLATDNSLMIAAAAYLKHLTDSSPAPERIRADGNMKLGSK